MRSRLRTPITRSPATDERLRAVGVVAIVVVVHLSAFRYTLGQLAGGVDITSPVVFVPFVPLAALASARQRWRGGPDEPVRVADRSADWITAFGLALIALVVGAGLPAVFTTETLTWRADLATVPIVSALAVVTLFGLRMLWRLRTVLWQLSLMSPAWYRPLIGPIRTLTSASTSWGVALVSHALPFVQQTESVTDGRRVVINSTHGQITLKVAEVCAGNGSVLAAIFMAISMWMLCDGTRRSKLRWSAACVALCWLGNLARLVAIFAGTSWLGEGVATGWFHELAGMVSLMLSLCGALALANRMGISPRRRAATTATSRRLPRVGRLSVVVLIALLIPLAAQGEEATTAYNLLNGRSDVATVSASDVLSKWSGGGLAPPRGLSATATDSIAWAEQYFGNHATWTTFLLVGGDGNPMAADVIATDDASRLDTYGLTACFGFHGWRMSVDELINLPAGRRAEHVVYTIKGTAAQSEARTPGASTRSVEVVSWRQTRLDGQIERVTLHQTLLDSHGTGQVVSAARELIAEVDRLTPTAGTS